MAQKNTTPLPPIEPLSERWEPSADPLSIDVPGLDRSAPVQDQIDYLEQMITIKLQNIDANFARAHQILSTKILPAVKRFAVNTEPIREAAKFWVSFYEQAAQVRIPTTEDFTEEFDDEQTPTQEEEEQGHGHEEARAAEPSVHEEQHSASSKVMYNASESSFASGHSLISSTPMSLSQKRHPAAAASNSQQHSESTSSWAHSFESPLDRLDRDLKSLTEEDESIAGDHTTQSSSQRGHASITGTTTTSKGKGKAKEPPNLLQNVLMKNIRGSAQVSPAKSRNTSPLKIRKTPKRNPYVPSNTKPGDWDGIVDLSNTPRHGTGARTEHSDEDSDLSLPPGMSLPVNSDFVRPIPSSHRFDVARSPAKEAAARIGRDLVGNVERLRFAGLRGRALGGTEESSISTMSPPSLSKHTRQALGMDSQTSSDPSLDNMMRRVGLGTTAVEDSFDDSSFDMTPNPAFFGHAHLLPEGVDGGAGGDSDDSSDSSFEDGNNGAPSAAFLMASQGGARGADDSFGSSNQSSDSTSDEEEGGDGGGGRVVHPLFAAGNEEDALDDSSEDDIPVDGDGATEEATIFGSRAAAEQQQPPVAGSGSAGELRLHGHGLLDDTISQKRPLPPAIPITPTPLHQEQSYEQIKPVK